jgi:ferredoxin
VSISSETRKLLLDGRIYDCRPGETVLDALTRQNVAVPNLCRHQVCLTCMMRSLGGAPPSASQTNLRDTLRIQHFFLACGCHENALITFPQARPASFSVDLVRVDGFYQARRNAIEPAGSPKKPSNSCVILRKKAKRRSRRSALWR